MPFRRLVGHAGREIVEARVLRIGSLVRSAEAAGGASVFGFAAVATGVENHASHRPSAGGEVERGHGAVVGAGIAALEGGGERPLAQPLVRVLRGERHHAAQRVASPQGRDRAASDFHAAQAVHVHEIAPRAQERAERKLVGNADAIDQREHPIAADAADAETGEAEAAPRAGHADAGLEAHQIGDVARQLRLDLFCGLHRNGGRHLVGPPLGARGHDDDRLFGHAGLFRAGGTRPFGFRPFGFGATRGGCQCQQGGRHGETATQLGRGMLVDGERAEMHERTPLWAGLGLDQELPPSRLDGAPSRARPPWAWEGSWARTEGRTRGDGGLKTVAEATTATPGRVGGCGAKSAQRARRGAEECPQQDRGCAGGSKAPGCALLLAASLCIMATAANLNDNDCHYQYQ